MAIDSQRRESITAAIKAAGLAALASLSPVEVLLLTGYWPVMGQSLAVVTCEGRCSAIVPEDELDLAKSTSDAEFIPYKPASLEELSDVSTKLREPAKELFSRLHLSTGDIGTDLHAGMQATPYQSADNLLGRLRSVKTNIEVDRIRHASNLAATGITEAGRAITAGRREDEIAADIESAFSRVARDGFERARGYFFCMSGPNSAKASGAYARTRRRVLQKDDLVMIHANTVGDGYWTDITRTFVVDAPSTPQRRMREAITEARAAALNIISPGVPAQAVDAAARDVLTRYGFGSKFTHPTGHGVGFAAADPNAILRIHLKSPDVLEAGMTFNIEPAIYCDGIGGMRHCDVVACTDSGADVLTDF